MASQEFRRGKSGKWLFSSGEKKKKKRVEKEIEGEWE